MSNYSLLKCFSDASILQSVCTTKDIAKRCKELNIPACCLTNTGNLSDCVQHVKNMKDNSIRPLIGIQLNICEEHSSIQTADNAKITPLVVIAKNLNGWKALLKISAYTNDPKHYYNEPRISLDELTAFIDKNSLLAYSGALDSHVGEAVINFGLDAGMKAANYLQRLFGEGNFWLETQLFDLNNNDMVSCTKLVRQIANKTSIPVIATASPHYSTPEQVQLQRILLCSNLKTTLDKAPKIEGPLQKYFTSDYYYIPSYEDMLSFGHTEEELKETNKFASKIDDFDILSPPQLPEFSCPNGLSNIDYLRQLCREGWKDLIAPVIPKDKWAEYGERVKYELGVLEEHNLAGYFLIIWDIIRFCKEKNILNGPARGSAAGCMVSYLIGITKVDPIKHDLIFSRFYSEGRNIPEHINFTELDYFNFKKKRI